MNIHNNDTALVVIFGFLANAVLSTDDAVKAMR
jgi:hypothetical protein